MVMRMLGEMAVANPSTGSFADYSRNAMGAWAGFSTAWLYWYFWVIVVGFEAVAGATVIQFWIPGIPLWVLSLILMVADDGHQPVLGQVVRRVRVLVRRHQGRCHRGVPGARRPVRVGSVAEQGYGLQQPDRSRRVPAARARRDLLRHRGRGLLHGRCRDRHHRRSRVARPGASHRPSDQLGDRADRDLLRRLDLPAGGDLAVELAALEASPYVSAFRRWVSRTPTTS